MLHALFADNVDLFIRWKMKIVLEVGYRGVCGAEDLVLMSFKERRTARIIIRWFTDVDRLHLQAQAYHVHFDT